MSGPAELGRSQQRRNRQGSHNSIVPKTHQEVAAFAVGDGGGRKANHRG